MPSVPVVTSILPFAAILNVFTIEEAPERFSSSFGRLMDQWLSGIKGLAPEDETLLDSLIKSAKISENKTTMMRFHSGIAGYKLEKENLKIFLRFYAADSVGTLEKLVGEIDVTDRLRSERPSTATKEIDQSPAIMPVVEKFVQAHALLPAYFETHAAENMPLTVVKVMIRDKTSQGLRKLISGSAEAVSRMSKHKILFQFVNEEKEVISENAEEISSAVKLGAKTALLAPFDRQNDIRSLVGDKDSVIYWASAEFDEVFAYTVDFVIASIVAQKEFVNLTNLEKSLIRSRMRISEGDLEKAYSLLKRRGSPDPMCTLKSLGVIPVDSLLQGARLALEAIGMAA